jgi:hypothetical protein
MLPAPAQAVGSWMEGWLVLWTKTATARSAQAKPCFASSSPHGHQQLFGGAQQRLGNSRQQRNYIAYDATGRAVGLKAGGWCRRSGTLSAANTSYTRTLCMNFVGRVSIQTGEVICN